MDSEAADLVLEVNELGLAALVVVGDGGLVKLEAHSLEVCHSAINKIGTDADVTVSAGALRVHKLKCLACKGGFACFSKNRFGLEGYCKQSS